LETQMARTQRAAERWAEQWTEHRRQRDEEERQRRVMVITEFDAGDPETTMHGMAEAILEYRRALRVLGRAVDLEGWRTGRGDRPRPSAPAMATSRRPWRGAAAMELLS
jgi:hypothetical protein